MRGKATLGRVLSLGELPQCGRANASTSMGGMNVGTRLMMTA